jgi:membrane protease YdiL (CAAX protease family)
MKHLAAAIGVTLLFVIVLLAATIAIRPLATTPQRIEIAGTIVRLAIAGLATIALLRIQPSLLRAPDSGIALAAVPALLYMLIVFPLLFTGSLALHGSALAAWTAANGFAAGSMEEIIFRGIVLALLLRRYSAATSVVVSSLLFSLPHALNLFSGSGGARVMAQLAWALLLAAALALLTIAGRSIWIAVAVHGIANAFVHVNRMGIDVDARMTLARAVWLALAPLPVLAVAILLFRRRRGE